MEYWHQCLSIRPLRFLFGSGLGSFVQVICLFKEWVTCNLFCGINESWPCWKCSVLSFSLLHHAYLQLKECMHSSTCVVFCMRFFQENPYYPIRGHQNFQWQNCKEIAPSNPNWLEFGHCKVFEVHKARKGPEITSLTWKVGRPWEWKSLKVGNKRCKRRFLERQKWW